MNDSETATVIVDSVSVDFSFQGHWVLAQGVDGSSVWQWPYMNVSRDTLMDLGGFTFTFEGFDATFVGSSRQPVYSTFPNSTITIDPDSDNPLVVSFNSPDEGPYYLPWYRTPWLPYGTHRVIVTKCVNEMVNYVLVTVGRETSLEGTTIFVDDADPQIQYYGVGWVQNNKSTRDADGYYTSLPAANTSMQTKNEGDSFGLSFKGTSATVYGLLSYQNTSSLTLQFDLDGQLTDVSFPVSQDDIVEQINFPFMSYNNLSPTFHQLKVTVKEISKTTFRFDYVTYSPAFPNLASLYPPGNPNVIFTPAAASATGGNEGDSLLKVIVGSVLGGLALLALAVGCLVCWSRRLKNRGRISGPQATGPMIRERTANFVTRTNLLLDKGTLEPLPSPTSPPNNQVLPYPPDKVPEATSSAVSEPSAFPVLEPSVSTTLSPYPAHKRPVIRSRIGSFSRENDVTDYAYNSQSSAPPHPNPDRSASTFHQSSHPGHLQSIPLPVHTSSADIAGRYELAVTAHEFKPPSYRP